MISDLIVWFFYFGAFVFSLFGMGPFAFTEVAR